MNDNYITLTIGKKKNIALIAHDNKKADLIEWCEQNKDILTQHFLCGTGTTARMITDKTGLPVKGYNSGPLGGDQQNRAARGNERYAVNARPKNVEWASQNMLVLGIIVILGLALHFMNFWYKMQFAEIIGNPMLGGLHAADGYGYIMQTFSNPLFFVLYIIWLIALWFHLTHGFWSAMQTLGWNNMIWINRWKCISNIYSTIIVLGFMVVAVVFFLKNMMGCGAC